jgi:hypothetical protein
MNYQNRQVIYCTISINLSPWPDFQKNWASNHWSGMKSGVKPYFLTPLWRMTDKLIEIVQYMVRAGIHRPTHVEWVQYSVSWPMQYGYNTALAELYGTGTITPPTRVGWPVWYGKFCWKGWGWGAGRWVIVVTSGSNNMLMMVITLLPWSFNRYFLQ